MDQHLIFLVLGLASGAVYAALALTLVVTYRSSGVVNFATGSMSLLGAYLYAFLRQGELLLPLPFLPRTVEVGAPLGFWPAALISVAVVRARRPVAVRRGVPAPALGPGGRQGGGVDRVDGGASPACSRSRVGTVAEQVRADPARGLVAAGQRAHLAGPSVVRGDRRGHRVGAHRRLPVHPLRAGHPRRGRDREGRLRQRDLAGSRRRASTG